MMVRRRAAASNRAAWPSRWEQVFPVLPLLSVLLLLGTASTGLAAPREWRITQVQADRVQVAAGSAAGIRLGATCEVLMEFEAGGRKRLVQVATCELVEVQRDQAIARLSRQQGSISQGYLLRLQAAPAPRTGTTKPPAPRTPPATSPGQSPRPSATARPAAPEGQAGPTAGSPTLRLTSPAPGSAPAEAPDSLPGKATLAPVRLERHEEFHAAAEQFLADPQRGDGIVYEARFTPPALDVRSHDQLSELAQLVSVLPFPGPWHTCFARPSAHHCALELPPDDPVFVRVDPTGYRVLRQALDRGDVRLRVLFTIRQVEALPLPPFSDADCLPDHAPYLPAATAYAMRIQVIGGVLELPTLATSLLLLKKRVRIAGDEELGLLDGSP